MALEIVNTIGSGGGSFIKPAELETATALLLEPQQFDTNVPTDFGPKDQVTMDITVFRSDEALESAAPDEELSGVRVQQAALVGSTKGIVGKGAVVTLGKGTAKPGRQAPWVFNAVDADTQKKVVTYVEKRDEEVPF